MSSRRNATPYLQLPDRPLWPVEVSAILHAMADIVLLQPPFEDFYSTRQRTLPLGLLYVAAGLVRAGYSVTVLDALAGNRKRQATVPRTLSRMRDFYPADKSPFALFHGFFRYGLDDQEILGRIQQERPRMVGVSLLATAYSDTAMLLARRIRERVPGAVLFCGGHHPTRFPDACLAVFDYVIRGDGDKAAVQLADAILKGDGDPGAVEGVCRLDAGVPSLKEPVFLGEPEISPLRPERSLAVPTVLQGRRFTQILTSRGCPLDCSYCCTTRRLSGGYRKRSVEDVLEEFRDVFLEHGITHFDIEDENATFDRERARTLFQGLIRTFHGKGVLLTAMNGLLPETLDHDLVGLMQEAGFHKLDLSLGSTKPEILKRYGRPAGLLGPFDRAVESARQRGMQVTAYVISGGPHVEAGDVLSDLLALAARPVRIGLSTYYPAPGSLDFEAARFSRPDSFAEYRASGYPVEDRMDRMQMVTASRLARVINYIKSLPSRGLFSLRSVSPATAGEAVRPGEEPRLAAAFLAQGILLGLSPGDRVAFPHRVDPALVQACRQGLHKAGKVAAFHGNLEV
jgi:anaerobic magnesium-protoporphyrin IX monomethyl ester cyclase